MVSRRWLPPVLILALISSSGLMFFQRNRTTILSKICKVGLGNLSKPAEISSDAIKCDIVGEKKTVTGVIYSSDHGSSIVISRNDTPISLWLNQAYPLLAKQLAHSYANYCINGATATLTGWRTQSAGQFGEMGYADEQIFVHSIDAVAPLPAYVIAEAGPDRTWCHRG